MLNNEPNKINKNDKQAIRLFTYIGIPKNIAKTLVYISKNGGCKSIEIEQETNQRQPEVCAATQELLKKGWITKFNYRKKTKGRPVQIYKLAFTINEILTKIEIDKKKEIESIKNDILTLKILIERRNQ
jgi:predicted transcriptional regulator